MDKKEIAEQIRQAIRDAEAQNTLAIESIDLVEKALWDEFHMKVQFGDEQTFRVIPNKGARSPYVPLNADDVARELIDPGTVPLSSKIMQARPIIEKFHLDNEHQKYEAVTGTGSAKQVARWVIMFRELAKLKAQDYQGVEGVSFKGAHPIMLRNWGGEFQEYMNTNGMHVNFSLLFNKKNMFHNQDILMHAVHGVKALAEETTLLTAMHPEDYIRYTRPESYKTKRVGITEKKNDISLRIVDPGWIFPKQKRVEDRSPSSHTNPYYAHLKILLGIYEGLKGNIEFKDGKPEPELEVAPADYGYESEIPTSKSMKDMFLSFFIKPKEAASHEPPSLHPIPNDIADAITEFEQGCLFRDVLNGLSRRYGHDRLLGDELHEEVMQQVQQQLEQQTALCR